ncbi:hypothetical protein [Immundisolibacter sp.]
MELPALISLKYSPYFIQAATIKAVQPLYQNDVFGITWDIDLSLLLEIRKRDGSTYDYQLNIRGNFKRDASGRILSWGSAFKIQKLFSNLSLVGVVNYDGTIEERSLQQLIGKDIYVLNYISGIKDDGRLRYQMWDIVAADRVVLQGDFAKSNESGYPKNYNPKAILDEYAETSSNIPSDRNPHFLNDEINDEDQDEFYL